VGTAARHSAAVSSRPATRQAWRFQASADMSKLMPSPRVETANRREPSGLSAADANVFGAMRDAVAGFLRGTNPARYRGYRRAAWRELRTETREAGPAELWRYTADMLYLIDNPVAREAFFPSGSQSLAVEPARADDASAVATVARRHEVAMPLRCWSAGGWTLRRRSP
jgi:hypothetical protein